MWVRRDLVDEQTYKVSTFARADDDEPADGVRVMNYEQALKAVASVQAALQTGCRYGELCRLLCGDFNPDSRTVHVRMSKSGKPRHVHLTDEGAAFFAGLTAGREAEQPMFGRIWKTDQQTALMKRACARASIKPVVSFNILRHSYASLSIMGGVPLMVVARNLGHTTTRMCEIHYGHLAASYVSEAIQAGAPRFGLEQTNVVRAR
jgi:integrase